jgi:hypothetical protein
MKRRRKRNHVSEFHRSYGCAERVEWVRNLPCTFCGRSPSENAHVTNGGTGRKADADKVIPACADYSEDGQKVRGCHFQMDHGIGKGAMAEKYGVDLLEEAQKIDDTWHVCF